MLSLGCGDTSQTPPAPDPILKEPCAEPGEDCDISSPDPGEEPDGPDDSDAPDGDDTGPFTHAFTVTAEEPFEEQIDIPNLGEGVYLLEDDLLDGLTIENGEESIIFSGTLSAGVYPLAIDLEYYLDGPSIYRTLQVTITAEADEIAVPEYGPAAYPDDRVHSPLTPHVADHIREILDAGSDALQDDVFLKAGASSTVSRNTLHCFADGPVDLGDHAHLQDTLDFFLGGDAAGSTPFDRDTTAARSGHSAIWVVDGDPSPLAQEIEAIDPRFALIHYGTNDMGLGSTYLAAMWAFHEAMMTMVDELTEQGIVPILTGISHRGDRPSANLWAETYNAFIRGMAQDRQIPFIDLHLAMDDLDGWGLASDGLHLESYSGGPCVLTEAGLEHGYNRRNLIVLEALDRLVQVGLDDVDALDEPADSMAGDGSLAHPFEIASLPFTDSQDTRVSGSSELSVYTGCDSDSDESGPEVVYRIELDAPTEIRAIVADRGDTDIDIHLLDASGTEAGCLERDHHMVEGTVGPGTYHLVLDTWVNTEGEAKAGEYLLTVVACHPDDTDCSTELD